jgi:hypothetical protein
MGLLTQSPAGEPSDDLSGRTHRQLIGYFGLALPFVLLAITAIWPHGASDPGTLGSVSAYYYTGAVPAFVGLLVALGLFLATYRGYDNKYRWADLLAARTAGVAAFLVALFPTEAPAGIAMAPWWKPALGVIHYTAAATLFSMFAIFSLWLFRLTSTGSDVRVNWSWRNSIYLICGVAIVVGMVWAALAGRNDRSIFVPESLALVAFALSWIVKGNALKPLTDKILPAKPGPQSG